MTVVLDSSALLALLWQEPGSDVVGTVIDEAVMSAVNWAEVISKLQERGIDLDEAKPMLAEMSLTIVPFDQDQAFAVGALRMASKHLGLSIGDRACLALAKQLSSPAYTADKTWEKLKVGVEVKLIR